MAYAWQSTGIGATCDGVLLMAGAVPLGVAQMPCCHRLVLAGVRFGDSVCIPSSTRVASLVTNLRVTGQ